ncbi:MOSC domain-containing protein [Mycolicibacterium pulveris]|uniref:MOSC domain-containing protein n=1 Tax=Mycolicibacterium pulveris TaxID=36813 RepID=UPI003CF5E2DF
MAIGQVCELWRYPVKSLGGGRVEQVEISARGLHGDRLWAVRDVARDVTASARRIPALLTATARYVDPVPADAGPGNVPEVEISFPDGTVLSSSDAAVHAKLSDLAGREVRLTALPPADDTSLHRLSRAERANTSINSVRSDLGITETEKLPDFSVLRMSDLATQARYSTPPGAFVDLAPVHVLSKTSVATIGAELDADLDVRRFRPNVLLTLDDPSDDLPESQWLGAKLTLGGVVLDVTNPTIRCVVPSRAQPGLDVDRRITRAVAERAQRCLGVYCWVGTAGTVRVGDPVTVGSVPAPRRLLADATRRAKRFTFGLATAAMERLSRER